MVSLLLHCLNTHIGVGELESIRIGDDLQENVVLVEDVGQLRVTSVIGHDLHRKAKECHINAKHYPYLLKTDEYVLVDKAGNGDIEPSWRTMFH